MTTEHEAAHPTRMLFLGDASLADGFRLIGFESIPDPTPEAADLVFRDLSRNREKAFVIVDDRIMRADCPNLRQVRREGGRIVVVSVPPLNSPTVLASEVADRLTALFGAGTLPPGASDHGAGAT
ncbi:V-type ATP synthase subunit F [uncultured Thiodictyon sp.]|uniref:V-type ATP synthase subunit F n=1 Tax=uncultured Thiodictyon sp. TaxID=1846217 RepID=UPI0025D8D89A|nr:V-type ATP synthase subunit F [uncultured Thiodictyon sp.]